MKSIFKRWIGWIIGVLVASYIFSLWRNENIEWDSIITLSIGGTAGMFAVEIIRNIVKKDRRS